MHETIMISIASYIGTNIDDMIINTFFFSLVHDSKAIRKIVQGKYLGIAILVLFSVIGSMGLKQIPIEYVRYLGVIPIVLGVKEAIDKENQDTKEDYGVQDHVSINLMWKVAIVTIANGADNIGVYTPLFTEFQGGQYVIFILVFVILTGIWCRIGYRASKTSLYEDAIGKYKKVIVPFVYILLGVYILLW